MKQKSNEMTLPIYAMRDKNLSLRAKGLYYTIYSYLSKKDILLKKSFLTNGDDAVERVSFDAAWQELKEKGYLKQYRTPESSKYELLEKPDIKTPYLIFCKK